MKEKDTGRDGIIPQKGRAIMQAYGITYTVRGENKRRDILIEAKDAKSAKRKIGKKHGYKDGRMIKVERITVVGYF